jgi:hypothetical protein
MKFGELLDTLGVEPVFETSNKRVAVAMSFTRALGLAIVLQGAWTGSGWCAPLSFAQQSSLPLWVEAALKASKNVEPCSCLNPFYQRGDFDGDGRQDYAVTVRDSSSGKVGLALAFNHRHTVRIIGAGHPIRRDDDDFRWMDAWQVFERGIVLPNVYDQAPPKLRGDALLLIKTESASGLVWWDGRSFRWYQMDD